MKYNTEGFTFYYESGYFCPVQFCPMTYVSDDLSENYRVRVQFLTLCVGYDVSFISLYALVAPAPIFQRFSPDGCPQQVLRGIRPCFPSILETWIVGVNFTQ